MSYDSLTNTFEIYSEDFDLMGFRQIEVQGYFVDHPLMTSTNLVTQIEIEHPCLRPAKVTAGDRPTPRPYYYTEGGIDFYASTVSVDPPVCNITFSCISVQKLAGMDDNVRCNDPDTITFNPETGLLNFETFDIDKYSLGKYKFNMRATVGIGNPFDTINADFFFIMELANPCPFTNLRNMNEFPFKNMRYNLGSDSIMQSFDSKDVIKMDSRIDCGEVEFEFIDQFGRLIDDELFDVVYDDTVDSDSAKKFVVKQQNNTETVGDYLIRYRASLKDYPTANVAVLNTPFIVTIVELKQSDYIFNIAPDWLINLEDQYLLLGNHLVYEFGEKTSIFGTDVTVNVNLRGASIFANYEQEQNAFTVNGDKTLREDLGLWKIIVEVTYDDPRNRQQYFSNFFYLHIQEFIDEIIAPKVELPNSGLNVLDGQYYNYLFK